MIHPDEPVILSTLEFQPLDPELSLKIAEIARRAFDKKVSSHPCQDNLGSPPYEFCPHCRVVLSHPGK